jgi:hypothetical protein
MKIGSSVWASWEAHGLNLVRGHELFLHSRSGVPRELMCGGKACVDGKEVAHQSMSSRGAGHARRRAGSCST